MPTKNNDPVITHPSARPNPRAPREAAGRTGRSRKPGPRLSTIDTVAGGTVAVTRPAMPRLFRFLLALTGVRV